MPQIHLLDREVAELIAAGEVVERPASVVKELIENSIDAGATSITVEIRGGGVGYLRVSDNGCGISQQDMPLAFLRHATSKVLTLEDLTEIMTLGFRGEALASVAAMAKVELRSRQKGGEGAKILAEGGVIGEPVPDGCPDGTTLIVRDIFYNTPARMKFMRRDVTEGNAIAQIVEKTALSHPEIAFRFIRDKETRLQTSGNGGLIAAIAAIYGREYAANMLPVDYKLNQMRVTGYVSTPMGAKASRVWQVFYLNGRYVRVRACSAALEEGFKGRLMTGRFPTCVLNIEMPHSEVDVNVHPAKTEVRFADERPVFQAVYYAVKSALSAVSAPLEAKKQPDINPLTIDIPQEKPIQQAMPMPVANIYEEQPKREESDFTRPLTLAAPGAGTITEAAVPTTVFEQFRRAALDISLEVSPEDPQFRVSSPAAEAPELFPTKQEQTLEQAEDKPAIRLIGELFSTYILLEQGEDFLLVDKHAAHEGVMYQRIRGSVQGGARQVLLSAVPVKLPVDLYNVLVENLDKLEAIAFMAEDFGAGTLLVRETPLTVYEQDVAAILTEVATKLIDNKADLTPASLEALCASIACKSSVRAGDRNSREELAEIIRLVGDCPEVANCPHGRPFVVRMSKYKLERMFGRII